MLSFVKDMVMDLSLLRTVVESYYPLLATVIIFLLLYLFLYTQPKQHLVQYWLDGGLYLEYKDHKIFYKDETGFGDSKDILVCLHGFPSSSYDFARMWPALLERFGRVICLDFLGFGFSDKPNKIYSINEQADVVNEILKHLGVKKVNILAHDYGDTVAQELLHRFNNKETLITFEIISVCLMNGGILPETHKPRFIQKLLMMSVIGPCVSRAMTYRTFKKGLGQVFGVLPSEEDFQAWWALVSFNKGTRIANRLVHYIPDRNNNRDRWVNAIKNTAVPVCLIYGPADPVNTPSDLPLYRKHLPNLAIKQLNSKTGHYPLWESPEETVDYYFKFLDN